MYVYLNYWSLSITKYKKISIENLCATYTNLIMQHIILYKFTVYITKFASFMDANNIKDAPFRQLKSKISLYF